jgi:hypothetical protein
MYHRKSRAQHDEISLWLTYSTYRYLTEKNTYNFYLVIKVPDHVYVFYACRLYFADKDIYMIRYFCHKIEIIRVIASTDIFCSAPPSAFRAHTCWYVARAKVTVSRSFHFPSIMLHVTSYTYQYRKRWRHDVAVATFLFPYTPPKTYTCQKNIYQLRSNNIHQLYNNTAEYAVIL